MASFQQAYGQSQEGDTVQNINFQKENRNKEWINDLKNLKMKQRIRI